MFEQGYFDGVSNSEYHADKAISRSAIVEFLRSPFHYYAQYIANNRQQKEQTPAMIFGSAFHTYVLEHHLFDKLYLPEPPKVLLKDVGREKYDAYKAMIAEIESSNKVVISDKDYLKLRAMSDAIQANQQARELLSDAIYERSYFWRDAHSQLMCKARPDVLHDNMIVDLKTCERADARSMSYAMRDGGYHIQAAMTIDAVREVTDKKIDTFVLVCIEKTYPYAIGIYPISRDAIEVGREKYKNTLLAINRANSYNSYASYEIKELFLP